ncbi:MAG: methyltransferase domain-containing protein [Acidimicrobiales bacterium]|jgi:SAM-dependent methyltransferase
MAHPEQREFIRLAIATITDQSTLRRVIEIGSFDVNGEIRSLFEHIDLEVYVGVDLTEGPGVDVVSLGHELQLDGEYFDLAISVECFEHDQFWPLTFAKMVELLKPGGWLVFTCASTGRPEHGTSRSDPSLSPGTSSRGFEYYKNLSEQDFLARSQVDQKFSGYQFVANNDVFDLYFIGQKGDGVARGSTQNFIGESQIKAIRDLTPAVHVLIRLPLKVCAHLFSEKAYQEFAYRYWKTLNSLQRRFLDSKFSRS